jgi:hypothetical protein
MVIKFSRNFFSELTVVFRFTSSKKRISEIVDKTIPSVWFKEYNLKSEIKKTRKKNNLPVLIHTNSFLFLRSSLLNDSIRDE